jgi:hypothetical protein
VASRPIPSGWGVRIALGTITAGLLADLVKVLVG